MEGVFVRAIGSTLLVTGVMSLHEIISQMIYVSPEIEFPNSMHNKTDASMLNLTVRMKEKNNWIFQNALVSNLWRLTDLTNLRLSFLSNRNQSINFHCKSIDRFLYDNNNDLKWIKWFIPVLLCSLLKRAFWKNFTKKLRQKKFSAQYSVIVMIYN